VTFNKGGKRRLIPMFDETPKELSIGKASPVLQKHCPAKLLDHLAQVFGSHLPDSSLAFFRPLSFYYLLKPV
jgi:hypothetical protein